MPVKIATIKPATNLTDPVSVWSVGNGKGLVIAEENPNGEARLEEFILLDEAAEKQLLAVLVERAVKRAPMPEGVGYFEGPMYYARVKHDGEYGLPWVQAWRKDRTANEQGVRTARELAFAISKLIG